MAMLTTPFALGESPLYGTSGVDNLNLDHLLGTKYELGSGVVYQLVKLAEDAIDVSKRVFIWVDRAAFTVTRSVTTAAPVAGVGHHTMIAASIPTSSYLLLQIAGRAQVRHGSEATNTLNATRMWAVQDVSDAGEVEGTATAPSAATDSTVYVGRYVSGTAATDATMVVELYATVGQS